MKVPMPMTRRELDQGGCGTPLCGHDHTILYIQPVCHPHSDVTVAYDKRTGVLTFTCPRCHRFITEIEVAG